MLEGQESDKDILILQFYQLLIFVLRADLSTNLDVN